MKRVQSSGILEVIGIERTVMKAKGSPIVHYRLDKNLLVQRLVEFLENAHLHQNVDVETLDENGQPIPVNIADKD